MVKDTTYTSPPSTIHPIFSQSAVWLTTEQQYVTCHTQHRTAADSVTMAADSVTVTADGVIVAADSIAMNKFTKSAGQVYPQICRNTFADQRQPLVHTICKQHCHSYRLNHRKCKLHSPLHMWLLQHSWQHHHAIHTSPSHHTHITITPYTHHHHTIHTSPSRHTHITIMPYTHHHAVHTSLCLYMLMAVAGDQATAK